ncbi:MAG: Ig-like domain-containing protein [Treponema sp.]|jgi:hypothetical protein|nr:Ig-like domain-containing protein [Treponema sp.]
MKKHISLLAVPVLLMLAGIFSACEDPSSGIDISQGNVKPPVPRLPTINGVEVKPGKAALGKGVKQQFTAVVSGGSGSETIVWTVIGNSDGETSIDKNSGLLKIGAGETAKVVNVTATVSTDSTQNGTASVIIIGNDEFPVENGLTVSPGIITVGKKVSQTFTAVLSADGTAADGVTWTLLSGSGGSSPTSGDAPGEGLTTLENGVLTVGEAETAACLTVRAEKGGLYGTAIVYIAENGGAPPEDDPGIPGVYPSNLGLAVSPSEATLDQGAISDAYTAELSKEGVTEIGDIAWALSGSKPADTSDKSEIKDAKVTVAPKETAEKLLVTATASVTDPADGGTVSGAAVVRVRGNEKPPIVVNNGVRIDPPDAVVVAGGSKVFTAEYGINGEAAAVTWRVLGGGAGTSVNEGGKLSVAAGEKAAYLTLRAEMKDGSGRYGTAAIKVSGEPGPDDGPISNGITVNPGRITLAKGGERTFTATDDEGATPTNVAWSIRTTGIKSGTQIGAADGKLKIAADESLPVILIWAEGAEGFGTAVVNISGSATLEPAVSKVTVSPAAVNVAQGGAFQFSAVVDAVDGADETVTWTITTTDVAGGTKFEADGLLKVDAAESPRTFTVRATSEFGDKSKYGEAVVTVPSYTVTAVKVSPSVTGARPGYSRQFTATVEGTNSPPQTVTWTVTTEAGGAPVAGTGIDGEGLLTVGGGETAEILTVKAVSTGDGGKSATAKVYTRSALFVATAHSSDKAAYSYDGENWEAATLPSSAGWYGVTYGGGKFVAVAWDSNTAAYSADGVNWTASPSGLPSSANWFGVAALNE